MISKDEIKCAARRFAWRSCNSHMKTKHDWEAGFNMGYEVANRMRAIKTRQELYGLLRAIYKRNGQDHIVETDQMAARVVVAAVKEATR